jgi:hypothetical protein
MAYPPLEGEQHRYGVRGDLLRAVGGLVDDRDAGGLGRFQVDRVDPHSGSSDDPDAGRHGLDVLLPKGLQGNDYARRPRGRLRQLAGVGHVRETQDGFVELLDKTIAVGESAAGHHDDRSIWGGGRGRE